MVIRIDRALAAALALAAAGALAMGCGGRASPAGGEDPGD